MILGERSFIYTDVHNTEQNGIYAFDGITQESIGYIVGEELDLLCSEDKSYEYFCNVADTFIGSPITAVARFASNYPDYSSLFRSRIRAVYRSSVWGQFSLLCEGISTPDELSECSSILKEAFCELEGEGREFNGFIEKGICIDTPMALYNIPDHLRFDFLCFDFKRLLYLCTGIKDSDIGAKELASHIISICSDRRISEIAVKAYTDEDPSEISQTFYPLKIKKFFFLNERKNK